MLNARRVFIQLKHTKYIIVKTHKKNQWRQENISRYGENNLEEKQYMYFLLNLSDSVIYSCTHCKMSA